MTPLFAEISLHWYLPPVIVAVSLVYSATRFESWKLIVSAAFKWALYILSFLGGTCLFLYFFSWQWHYGWYLAVIAVMMIYSYGPTFWPKRKAAASEEPAPVVNS